jgi:hypothetical protein
MAAPSDGFWQRRGLVWPLGIAAIVVATASHSCLASSITPFALSIYYLVFSAGREGPPLRTRAAPGTRHARYPLPLSCRAIRAPRFAHRHRGYRPAGRGSAGRWPFSRNYFTFPQILDQRPDAGPSRAYWKRCQEYLFEGPPWAQAGVFTVSAMMASPYPYGGKLRNENPSKLDGALDVPYVRMAASNG